MVNAEYQRRRMAATRTSRPGPMSCSWTLLPGRAHRDGGYARIASQMRPDAERAAAVAVATLPGVALEPWQFHVLAELPD